MEDSRRFTLFRALTFLEIALMVGCGVWILAGAEGVFVLALLMTAAYAYAAGFVIAILGVLKKPRQRLMLISLAIHALIGVVLLLGPSFDKWMNAREQDKYKRMREEYPPE